MKINNKYILSAQDVLGANAGGLLENDKVPSIYNGYISSFGGSMVQIGLYATVLTYSEDVKKKIIAELVFNIYKEQNLLNPGDEDDFLHFVRNNQGNRQVRNNIAQAVIALKLVLRTFRFSNEKEV